MVDTWGIPRGKRIPVAQFLRGSGYHLANVIYVWSPRCDINPTPWVNEADGFPDMQLVPDLSSFRVAGWEPGVAVVMCDSSCPRSSGLAMPLASSSRAARFRARRVDCMGAAQFTLRWFFSRYNSDREIYSGISSMLTRWRYFARVPMSIAKE